MDWLKTITIKDVVAALFFFGTLVGVYYEIKGDVNTMKTQLTHHTAEVEKLEKAQAIRDDYQDKQVNQIYLDLKTVIRDNGNELKTEIRDLRSDLMKSRANR